MKIILLDAVHTFVDAHGTINQKLYELLEEFENPKIICTNASIEKFEHYSLNNAPYSVFTLSGDPSKVEGEYFEILLNEYSIFASECIYIEHSKEAIASAESLGILSYHFDTEKKDLESLQKFLKDNLN
jgi:FMN phosphatase YigB (HAD superfamily)